MEEKKTGTPRRTRRQLVLVISESVCAHPHQRVAGVEPTRVVEVSQMAGPRVEGYHREAREVSGLSLLRRPSGFGDEQPGEPVPQGGSGMVYYEEAVTWVEEASQVCNVD